MRSGATGRARARSARSGRCAILTVFCVTQCSGALCRNTLVLSIGNILINFPIPILFAILLNEVRAKKFKKFVQTVSYMPRFISTVVVIAILNEILSPSSGILNQFLGLFGVDPIYFMNEPQLVPPGVYFIRDLAVHGVDGHYLPGGHHLHQPGPV